MLAKSVRECKGKEREKGEVVKDTILFFVFTYYKYPR
jgi:hypothetical protein